MAPSCLCQRPLRLRQPAAPGVRRVDPTTVSVRQAWSPGTGSDVEEVDLPCPRSCQMAPAGDRPCPPGVLPHSPALAGRDADHRCRTGHTLLLFFTLRFLLKDQTTSCWLSGSGFKEFMPLQLSRAGEPDCAPLPRTGHGDGQSLIYRSENL